MPVSAQPLEPESRVLEVTAEVNNGTPAGQVAELIQIDLEKVNWMRWNAMGTELTVQLSVPDAGWTLQVWSLPPGPSPQTVLLDSPSVDLGRATAVLAKAPKEGSVLTVVLVRQGEPAESMTVASWEFQARSSAEEHDRGTVYKSAESGGTVTVFSCTNSSCAVTILWKEPLPPGIEDNPESITLTNGETLVVNNSLVVRARCVCG